MKFFILSIIFITNIFSNTIFWDKVEDIEKNYYATPQLLSKDKTTDVKKNNSEIDSLDKKYDSFNSLFDILKQTPFDVTKADSFEMGTDANTVLKLQEKININTSYSNDLAVKRDNINIQIINLKIKIKEYFIALANGWTSFDKDTLLKLNKQYTEYLASINYSEYLELYKNLQNYNGEVEVQTKEVLVEFSMHYRFFSDILSYTEANRTIFYYQSFTTFLDIDMLIEVINTNQFFANLNPHLRFIHTDAARVVLFILIIVLFIIIDFFIYKIIYGYLKKVLLLKHTEIHDNILENLDKMRKPLNVIIIIIGLKLSYEILIYPDAINSYLSDFIYFICLLLGVHIINIILDVFVYSYFVRADENADKIRKELILFSKSLIKVIILFAITLLFLMKMGVNISAILASLGIGGLAVALAAQTTLSNFFGLIKMIMDNSFSQGDWIETPDVSGTVVEVGFISTTIRTFDNAVITIPNSTLANSSITNWNKRKLGRRVKMYVAVTYASKQEDIQKAVKEIKEMLIAHPRVATEQEVDYEQINKHYKKEQRLVSVDDKYGIKSRIFVYLDRLSDSSMDILIDFFTKDIEAREWLEIKEDVIYKVWSILEANNLEFAFPTQTLYLKGIKEDL